MTVNYSHSSHAVQWCNLFVTLHSHCFHPPNPSTVYQLHHLGPNPSADPPSLELASRAGYAHKTMDVQFRKFRWKVLKSGVDSLTAWLQPTRYYVLRQLDDLVSIHRAGCLEDPQAPLRCPERLLGSPWHPSCLSLANTLGPWLPKTSSGPWLCLVATTTSTISGETHKSLPLSLPFSVCFSTQDGLSANIRDLPWPWISFLSHSRKCSF